MNLETRIAERMQSIFKAIGTIISDFYLEAGIYFVGGFNALLVAWGIWTDLQSQGQPIVYAVVMAMVTFIAVEGLAIYLVGAAAKTNNNILWFFSIVFAGFFTYAHWREMVTPGVIDKYLSFAIPFFVMIGYWAKTVKADIDLQEKRNQETEIQAEERAQELAAKELLRQQQIEDETRHYEQEQTRLAEERKHELKVSKLTQKEVPKKAQNLGVKDGDFTVFASNFDTHNSTQKLTKSERIIHLQSLLSSNPNLSNSELADQLKVSRQTIINYKKNMANGVAK